MLNYSCIEVSLGILNPLSGSAHLQISPVNRNFRFLNPVKTTIQAKACSCSSRSTKSKSL